MENRSFPADFEADFEFISAEEGGRKTGPPFQGYRSDFVYEGDRSEDGMYMIWPEFLDSEGRELAKGKQAPASGRARFYIVNKKLRKEIHCQRIKVGTRFFMMEGPHKVARGVVSKVLALQENAARSSA